MRQVAYLIAQAAWGFPQTIAGLVVYAAHARCPHGRFHGSIVTAWESYKALSLGPFIFLHGPSSLPKGQDVCAEVDERLLVHEYGHTVQSLILGPLYLVIIGLPSIIWLNAGTLSRMRRTKGRSYYTFYTESTANWLGEQVLKRPSVGLDMID